MKSEEMKTIGLIGGMSFESTLTYYQIINETIKKTGSAAQSGRYGLESIRYDTDSF